jgi:hypothetical protein
LYLSWPAVFGGETPQTYLLNLSESFANMAAAAMESVITGQAKHDIGITRRDLAEYELIIFFYSTIRDDSGLLVVL